MLGFKCFLVHPGIEEFTMVGEQDLRQALPHVAKNRAAAAGARGASWSARRGDGALARCGLDSLRDILAVAAG